MTTPPIVSITDELISELEVFVSTPVMFAGTVRPIQDAMRTLLAERAELKKLADAMQTIKADMVLDAERYRFWRYMATHEPSKIARILATYESPDQLDAAIDAAIRL